MLFQRILIIFLCLPLTHIPSLAKGKEKTPNAPVTIRIGVSEYQNIEDVYRLYTGLFHDLAKLADREHPVSFEVAVGDYAEVLDWWEKKQIDAAVLAATPMAMLFNGLNNKERQLENSPSKTPDRQKQLALERERLNNSYVATTGGYLGPTFVPSIQRLEGLSIQQQVQLHRKVDNVELAFHTVALVRNSPDLANVNTLKEILSLHRPVRFLYVRPLSASGYILPKHALELYKDDLSTRSDITEVFTYQQPASIKRLVNYPMADDDGKILVAFVHDSSKISPTQLLQLKVVQGLEELNNPIPYNVLLVNYNIPETFDRNKKLLTDLVNKMSTAPPSPFGLIHEADWVGNYADLQKWMAEVHVDLSTQREYHATLDDIIDP